MDIKLSESARCAREQFCFRGNKKARKQWVKDNELFVDGNGTVYASVRNGGQSFLMDCITGSLYQNGACLTSSALFSIGAKKDQENGEKILLSKVLTEAE